MTQTTLTDNLLVDGSQDIKQLRVQGHTTQIQPIQTWEDSAGGILAQVTGDGRLIVGDDVTPDSLIEAHRLETSTSKPKRGLHSMGRISGTLATLVQWMVGELELRGSNAIDALHTGLRIRAANMNTGTPTANAELRAADVEVINDATAGAAALPKATGLQVAVTNASGKTITDAAALRLKLNNTGTITNPYAIFSEGPGITHLEDFVELKVPVAGVPGPSLVSDVMRVYPKSDGKLYAKNSGGTEYDLTASGGGGSIPDLIILEDQKAANTFGGSFTSGAWRTRVINTEVVDTGSICTLASNQFTLPAGTYEIDASAPAIQVAGHMIRLQNITDATTVAYGSTEYSNTGGAYAQNRSTIAGYRFTIAGSKTFELQHRCTTTLATTGMGRPANVGVNEIYSRVVLRKIA